MPLRGGAEASLAGFMVCNCVLGRLCPLFLLLMVVCVLFLAADLCVGGARQGSDILLRGSICPICACVHTFCLCVPGNRAVWPAAQCAAETVSAAVPVL